MEVMLLDIFQAESVLAATVGSGTPIKQGANIGSLSYFDQLSDMHQIESFAETE